MALPLTGRRWSIRLFGLPVPQAAPQTRVVQMPGRVPFANVYDHPKSKSWKLAVKYQVSATLPDDWRMFEGAIAVEFEFYLPRPVSLSPRIVHHTKKPDLTNLEKSTEDALRGVVYRDDALIIEKRSRKQYASRPGVAIVVEERP